MARKLKAKKGREVYAWRKAIVEPVFGEIHTRLLPVALFDGGSVAVDVDRFGGFGRHRDAVVVIAAG